MRETVEKLQTITSLYYAGDTVKATETLIGGLSGILEDMQRFTEWYLAVTDNANDEVAVIISSNNRVIQGIEHSDMLSVVDTLYEYTLPMLQIYLEYEEDNK